MAEEEYYMESIHDRDLNNDGIPDIYYDKKAKSLAFKDPKILEIYKRYISYDHTGRNAVLSTGAILVDIVQELRKIRKLKEKEVD